MSDVDDWEGPVPDEVPKDRTIVELYAERNGRLLLVLRGEEKACVVPEPVQRGAFAEHAEHLAKNGVGQWMGETMHVDGAVQPLELAAAWEEGEVLTVRGIGPGGEEAGEPPWKALRYLGPDRP